MKWVANVSDMESTLLDRVFRTNIRPAAAQLFLISALRIDGADQRVRSTPNC
jgi:hypothetical protein